MNEVLATLALFGVAADRRNTGVARYPGAGGRGGRFVRFSHRGDPDISATLPDGRRLEIEAKATGERPTRAQWERILYYRASGAVAFWTDDAGFVRRVLPHLLAGSTVWMHDDGTPEVVPKGGRPRYQAPPGSQCWRDPPRRRR